MVQIVQQPFDANVRFGDIYATTGFKSSLYDLNGQSNAKPDGDVCANTHHSVSLQLN
jgi:hypothetical protein